jgi:hypothetical protein
LISKCHNVKIKKKEKNEQIKFLFLLQNIIT